MTISASQIQKLRQLTGAKMMDCKNALQEVQGDIEAAKEWLRKKGMASGAKKTERPASEGVIAVIADQSKGAVLEINCETDFVARTDDFQNFVREVLHQGFKANSKTISDVMTLSISGETVQEKTLGVAGKLGENIVLRRLHSLSVDQGVVVPYTHGPIVSGMGKIGVLVGLESAVSSEELMPIGKKLAMHIAACTPSYIDTPDVPAEAIEKERTFLSDQYKEMGRPEEVIGKMVEGGIRKFVEDKVLLEQKFVCDAGKTVRQFLKEEGERLGSAIKVAGFIRLMLGSEEDL